MGNSGSKTSPKRRSGAAKRLSKLSALSSGAGDKTAPASSAPGPGRSAFGKKKKGGEPAAAASAKEEEETKQEPEARRRERSATPPGYQAAGAFRKRVKGKSDEERTERNRLICEFWRKSEGTRSVADVHIPTELVRMVALYGRHFWSFAEWPTLKGGPFFKLNAEATSVACHKNVKKRRGGAAPTDAAFFVARDAISIKDTIHQQDPVFVDVECLKLSVFLPLNQTLSNFFSHFLEFGNWKTTDFFSFTEREQGEDRAHLAARRRQGVGGEREPGAAGRRRVVRAGRQDPVERLDDGRRARPRARAADGVRVGLVV